MGLEEIMEILNNLSLQFNDNFDIEVSINSRLTRTLGRVKYNSVNNVITPIKMEFSKEMLETVSREDIISVVRHEWAHYYIGKTTRENHKHDSVFKALCDKINCHGTTAIKIERTTKVQSKYTVTCEKCGKVVGEYSRKCKTTSHPEFYRTNCCKANLIVTQNF